MSRARTFRRLRRWPGGFCWLSLLVAHAPMRGHAQSPDAGAASPLSANRLRSIGYTLDQWSAEDGHPLSVVWTVAQTPDGYLWCGTSTGLARFDGFEFTVFRSTEIPALGGEAVKELHCDSAGRLWIGCSGGRLAMYEAGLFRWMNGDTGFEARWGEPGKYSVFWRFAEGPDGALWVHGQGDKTSGRFFRYRGGRFETVVVQGMGRGRSRVEDFAVDAKGVRWFVLLGGNVVYRHTASGIKKLELTPLDGGSPRITSRFFRLRDGTLALATDSGIFELGNAGWRAHRDFPDAVASSRILDAVEDRNGSFWLAGAEGRLFLSDGPNRLQAVRLPEQSDLSLNSALIEDDVGNLWIAGHHSLYRLQPNAFRSWGEEEGIFAGRTISVVEDAEGEIWTTTSNGVYALDGETVRLVEKRPSAWKFWLAARAAGGGVYISQERRGDGAGKWQVERWDGGRRERLAGGAGILTSMYEDSPGRLWVGNSLGLRVWNGAAFEEVEIAGVDGAFSVADITADREGNLVVVVSGVGLFRQAGESWSRITGEGDRGSGSAAAVHIDADGLIWVSCGEEGLGLWREGSWHLFEEITAPPNMIDTAVADDRDGLWLRTDLGLRRVSRSALLERVDGVASEIAVARFDRSDGMISSNLTGWQTGLLRSGDGMIWVSTYLGVSVTDPSRWEYGAARAAAPPVYIESALVDTVDAGVVGGVGPSEFVVEAGSNIVEIHYAAIDLSSSLRSRFRHRLVGYDEQWVESGAVGSATYRKLDPGRYRFEVEAGDLGGRWSGSPALLDFVVESFWWQRGSVRAAAVLALVTWVAFLWWKRARRLAARHARREEFSRQLIALQEGERQRIAAELHDGLGQNMLLISHGLHRLAKVEGVAQGGAETLEKVEGIVSRSVEEVRSISHNLHPFKLERLGLAKTLKGAIRQVSEAANLDIEAEIGEVDGLLPPATEINLYRIVQEALNNIIKHSGASSAQIRVAAKAGRVLLDIEDDGTGFDVDAVGAGEAGGGAGFGLRSMAERTLIAKGVFEYDSTPRGGTRLHFEFPYERGK